MTYLGVWEQQTCQSSGNGESCSDELINENCGSTHAPMKMHAAIDRVRTWLLLSRREQQLLRWRLTENVLLRICMGDVG
jgi:hypothetical protein